MKKTFLSLFLILLPALARAQGVAPELYNVREVVLEYARFDDAKTASTCGLSREQINSVLLSALKDGGVPVTPAADARPASLGVARIDMVPEIYTYANESLDCISFISLSAENHVSAIIPPVQTMRHVTAVYWSQRVKIASGLSTHAMKITDTLQKMAAQFAQQYRVAQPPDTAQ